jgi:hypothetical protein
VAELNAPNAVRPGGASIPAGGYAFGNVIGRDVALGAPGLFYVAVDEQAGLFACTSTGQGTLVNTAPLTGTTSLQSVVAVQVFRSGVTFRAAPIGACTLTGAPSAVMSTVGCDIVMQPTHKTGTNGTVVRVTSGGWSANLPLVVWAPILPMSVEVSSPALGPVVLSPSAVPLATMRSGPNCQVRYTDTTVKAFVRFATGDTNAVKKGNALQSDEFDVTRAVMQRIAVSNTSVLRVNATTGRVSAVNTGACVSHIYRICQLSVILCVHFLLCMALVSLSKTVSVRPCVQPCVLPCL